MNEYYDNSNRPRVGFCVMHHPLELGNERSPQVLSEIIKEFSRYDINFIPFNEIIDDDNKAEIAGKYFYDKEIDVLLTVEVTWANDYFIVDILEYIDVPIILWAIPGMDNGSLCGCHQLGVVLTEIGKKYEIFYGDIRDKKIHKRALSFSKAAGLKKFLRKQKIGLIGYRVPGMTEVTFDELELKRKFGPRVIHFGINSIKEMIGKIDDVKAKKVWNDIKNSGVKIKVNDSNGVAASKYFLILDEIAKKNKIKGFAVECYPEFLGEFCFAASRLAGKNIVLACEADVNSATAMIILNYLTGMPVNNTDLLNPDSANSVIFSHCGSSGFLIAEDKKSIELRPVRLLDKGVCVTFLPKLDDITLINIVGRKDSYRVSTLEAYSQKTKMVFPGNPVSARFNISVEKFLDIIVKNAVGHHWMIGYGKVLEEIKYFSSMIGVKFIDFS